GRGAGSREWGDSAPLGSFGESRWGVGRTGRGAGFVRGTLARSGSRSFSNRIAQKWYWVRSGRPPQGPQSPAASAQTIHGPTGYGSRPGAGFVRGTALGPGSPARRVPCPRRRGHARDGPAPGGMPSKTWAWLPMPGSFGELRPGPITTRSGTRVV